MFDIKRRLDLNFLGEGWGKCYLDFHPAFIREIQKLASFGTPKDEEETKKMIETALSFLKGKFIEGKALKSGKVVAVKKDDLEDFPVEVLTAAVELLAGGPDKKK